MNYRGQAVGRIDGGIFSGNFQAEYEATYPLLPSLNLGLFGLGTFAVELDQR
jgi:hypothetical protein